MAPIVGTREWPQQVQAATSIRRCAVVYILPMTMTRNTLPLCIFAGGGVSRTFPRACFQHVLEVPHSPSKNGGRGMPDVAGVADPHTVVALWWVEWTARRLELVPRPRYRRRLSPGSTRRSEHRRAI
jgi:hypothetical protein